MLLALLAGCPVAGFSDDPSGGQVWMLFPFDGVRTWTYQSTDVALPYRLVASSSGEYEADHVYTVEYTTECVTEDPSCVDGDLLRRVKWSSDSTDGVHLRGYDVGAGFVDLDPPVQLTTDDMARDDVIETVTGGATWTSTMLGIEACPVALSAAWDECAAFELAVDVGDGAPLAGTYWATLGNGTAALELAHETGQWQLSDLTCDGDCDGTW